MRCRPMITVLVVPVLALSACRGAGEADGEEPRTPTASASPSRTAQTPAPAPADVPRPATTAEAAELGVVVLGVNAARTPEEQAIVEAWMRYWAAVAQTYDQLEPAPGLEESARGRPLTDVLDRLDDLRSRNHRSAGWTRQNVLEVVVDGDTAVLRDCAENFAFEVDSSNRPTEEVVPFYSTLAQLTKDGDRWVVTAAESQELEEDCRA
jgi:hypothetical protein